MTHKISVDLNQLRECANALVLDIEAGLAPGLSAAGSRIQHGIRFARTSPSGDAEPARQALRATLIRHRENGQHYVEAARFIASAIDHALTLYLTTDTSVDLDLNKLLETIADSEKESGGPTASRGMQP